MLPSRFVNVLMLMLLPLCSLAGDEQAPQNTALLGAMGMEIKLFHDELTDKQMRTIQGVVFTIGNLKGRKVILARSGIGKVNAAITTTLLIEHFKPAEIIFTGIAGGINPELHPGDVLIAAKTAQHDYGDLLPAGMMREGTRNLITWERNPIFYPADARLLGIAENSATRIQFRTIKTTGGDRTPSVRKGVVVTGDVFVAASDKKAELRKALEADAVEMEGAAVAQVCFQQRVPCLVIRSISDLADANAAKQAQEFGHIAAENSAKFVIEIIQELLKASTAKNEIPDQN